MTIEKKTMWLIYSRPFEGGGTRRIIGAAPSKDEAERMGQYLSGEGSWDSVDVEGPFPIYYGATEDAIRVARVERQRLDAEIKATEARLRELNAARV